MKAIILLLLLTACHTAWASLCSDPLEVPGSDAETSRYIDHLLARLKGKRINSELVKTIERPVVSAVSRQLALEGIHALKSELARQAELDHIGSLKRRFEASEPLADLQSQALAGSGIAHVVVNQNGFNKIYVLPGEQSDLNRIVRDGFRKHHAVVDITEADQSSLWRADNLVSITFQIVREDRALTDDERGLFGSLGKPEAALLPLEPPQGSRSAIKLINAMRTLGPPQAGDVYDNPGAHGPRRIEVSSRDLFVDPLKDALRESLNRPRVENYNYGNFIVDGCSATAESLLPPSIRQLGIYGHSFSSMATDASCHTASILITRPSTLAAIEAGELPNDYIESTYRQLGAGEDPQYGDIAMIYRYLSADAPIQEEENPKFMHAVVFVTDRLVWSKNGEGSVNPLFIRDWADVLKEWIVKDEPRPFIVTIVKFFRNEEH